MSQIRTLISPLIAALAALLFWENIVQIFDVPTYILPAPSDVLSILLGLREQAVTASLFAGAGQTAIAAFLGFLLAALLGIVLGTILSSMGFLRRGVYPLANLLQMVPIIALAPLLNIWFGYGIPGVAASACIVAIFPVIASTVDGLRSVNPQLAEMVKLYGTTSTQQWRLLGMWSALPHICTGLRVAAGLAVIGAVVGEMMSGVLDAPPLGTLIAAGLRNSDLDLVFAAILLSALIGFTLFGLVAFASHRTLSPWHPSTRKSNGSIALVTGRKERFVQVVLAGGLGLMTVWAWSTGDSAVEGPKETTASTVNTAESPRRIRIQLNWVPEPEFGGIYAAEHLGYFREEGLEVDLIKGGPGVASPQLVATGQVEFGVVSGAQIITMRAQAAPLVAIYANFNRFVRGIVTHAAVAPPSLESLWTTGGTVGVEAGLPFVRWLDHRYGKTKKRLVQTSGGLGDFKRSKDMAQAVFVFAEPVTLALDEIETRVFPVADSGFNPYSVVLATNENYLRTYPDRVKSVQKALRRGWAAYLSNPTPTNRILSKMNPAMSLRAMNLAAKMIAPYVRGDEPKLGWMDGRRWAELARQLKTVGVVDKTLDGERCFDNLD